MINMKFNNESEIACLLRSDKCDLLTTLDERGAAKAVSYALQGPAGSWGSEYRGKLSQQENKGRALALAVELGHAASLIVDDMIDGTRVRRNHPSFWVAFGKGDAVITAHLLVGLAFKLVALNDVPQRAIARLAEAVLRMTTAELIAPEIEHSAECYLKYMSRKTGALVSTTASLASALAEHTGSDCEAAFEKVGILHQISDDVVDAVQDSLSKTSRGRMNFLCLPESERQLVLEWQARTLDTDVPSLFVQLESRPSGHLLIEMTSAFIARGRAKSQYAEREISSYRNEQFSKVKLKMPGHLGFSHERSFFL
jgi:Polyprenyl synthetase